MPAPKDLTKKSLWKKKISEANKGHSNYNKDLKGCFKKGHVSQESVRRYIQEQQGKDGFMKKGESIWLK